MLHHIATSFPVHFGVDFVSLCAPQISCIVFCANGRVCVFAHSNVFTPNGARASNAGCLGSSVLRQRRHRRQSFRTLLSVCAFIDRPFVRALRWCCMKITDSRLCGCNHACKNIQLSGYERSRRPACSRLHSRTHPTIYARTRSSV